MAHFAEIDDNNIVLRVVVVDDLHEHRGEEYLSQDCNLGGRWIKTSYNTSLGVHMNGGIPFRKNFAGPGMIYDSARDAFYHQKPYPSWILNEESCIWEPPIAYPEEINVEMPIIRYKWDEESLSWQLINL